MWQLLTSKDTKISDSSQTKINVTTVYLQQQTIDNFLQIRGRKHPPILGDGNCLFPTTSYAHLNTENHHFPIRLHVVRLINLNSEVFSLYLMPVNRATIMEHVQHLNRPYVCGTP